MTDVTASTSATNSANCCALANGPGGDGGSEARFGSSRNSSPGTFVSPQRSTGVRLLHRRRRFRHRDRQFGAARTVVISPASVAVLHEHLRRPCSRSFGLVEAMSGRMCRRGAGQQQKRQHRGEHRKTMLEADIVSDTRRVARAGIDVIEIAPLREALPAHLGFPMPERSPDVIHIAPAEITDHCCASSMMRRSSARTSRCSSSLISSSPARLFGSE